MTSASELRAWLNTLPSGAHVAVDDGGLALVHVEDQETYIEVGGVPEPPYIQPANYLALIKRLHNRATNVP